jgi:hypothetical protein
VNNCRVDDVGMEIEVIGWEFWVVGVFDVSNRMARHCECFPSEGRMI